MQDLSFKGGSGYFLWGDEQRINKRKRKKKKLGRRERFSCREVKVSPGSFRLLSCQWHPGKCPAGESSRGTLSKSKLQQVLSC